jgi:hypothetical protein
MLVVLTAGVVACSSFGTSDTAGSGGAAPAVGCSSSTCAGGAYCCVHGRNTEPIECVTGQAACPEQFGARAYCDDTSDCSGGNVCCLQFGGIFGILASCVTSAACVTDDTHNRLCDPAIAGECGAGSCVALTTAHPGVGWRLVASACQP